MSSHENRVAAHRKPVLVAVSCQAGEGTGHDGQTRAAAPRASGPAGSKGAANCAESNSSILRKRALMVYFSRKYYFVKRKYP
jgi:hypothetical protein